VDETAFSDEVKQLQALAQSIQRKIKDTSPSPSR